MVQQMEYFGDQLFKTIFSEISPLQKAHLSQLSQRVTISALNTLKIHNPLCLKDGRANATIFIRLLLLVLAQAQETVLESN